MNESCPIILYPETDACSGRGTCLLNSAGWAYCACDDSSTWIGRGDFIFGSPTCGISARAIQAMHGVLGVIGVCALISALRYARVLYQMHNKTKPGNLAKLMAASSVLCGLFIAAYGFYHVAHPGEGIGSDVTATVLFSLGGVAYNTAGAVFYYSLFVLAFSHAGMSHTPENEHTFFMLKLYVIAYAVFTVIFIVQFLIMLGVQTKLVFDILVPAYLAVQSCCYICLTSMYIVVGPRATTAIRERAGDRAKSGVLSEVLSQIEGMTKGAIASCLVGLVLYTLVAVWEGLRNIAYPYVFVSIWIQATSLLISATSVLTKVSSGVALETIDRVQGEIWELPRLAIEAERMAILQRMQEPTLPLQDSANTSSLPADELINPANNMRE